MANKKASTKKGPAAKATAKKAPPGKSSSAGRKPAAAAARAPAAKAGARKAPAKRAAATSARKAPAKRATAATSAPIARTAPATTVARKPADAAAESPASTTRTAPARRDRAGHIAEDYARDLLARSGRKNRGDDTHAFITGSHSSDDLAERLGEEAVETMTSGEDEGNDILDEVVEEERGGPFVVSRASDEFADGVDESNPEDAEREPLPTV